MMHYLVCSLLCRRASFLTYLICAVHHNTGSKHYCLASWDSSMSSCLWQMCVHLSTWNMLNEQTDMASTYSVFFVLRYGAILASALALYPFEQSRSPCAKTDVHISRRNVAAADTMCTFRGLVFCLRIRRWVPRSQSISPHLLTSSPIPRYNPLQHHSYPYCHLFTPLPFLKYHSTCSHLYAAERRTAFSHRSSLYYVTVSVSSDR